MLRPWKSAKRMSELRVIGQLHRRQATEVFQLIHDGLAVVVSFAEVVPGAKWKPYQQQEQ